MKIIMRTTGDRDVSEYNVIPELILSTIEEKSAYKNFINALRLAEDDSSLHLEDDIILCDNFMERIMSVIRAHEKDVIQFFTGVRDDDINIGTRYVNGSDFLWAQCFYLPAGMSKAILEFSNGWDKADSSEPLDSMVSDYLKLKKIKYLRICPSLVDHKDGKSLINSKRNPHRTSRNFAKEEPIKRQIEIKCDGAEYIDYKSLIPLQGKLKSRTKEQRDKSIKTIIEQGFSFPFFVWRDKKDNYVLDGHGRLLALEELASNGYIINNSGELIIKDDQGWEIPPIPIDLIDAKDKEDAKIKLLKASSMYGKINGEGLNSFQEGFTDREIDGLEIKIYDTPQPLEINTEKEQEEVEVNIGNINLNPTIDLSVVTEESIRIAEEKASDKHALNIDTVKLICKCCGKEMEIRKSDFAIKINETLYKKEEAYG